MSTVAACHKHLVKNLVAPQAMCEQVERDQLLMRERLVRVGGQQAGGRMDGALQAVRAAMELTLQSAEE